MNSQDLKGWAWQPDKCPADQDFIEYVHNQELGIDVPTNIFHMGTGLHHTVGRSLAHPDGFVLGVTLSPAELQQYLETMQFGTVWNREYYVHYGDLNCIEERVIALRQWDYVTLFHLGEIFDEYKYRHNPVMRSPYNTIELFGRHLAPNGQIVAYVGSVAWQRVASAFEELCDLREEYKSLRFYTVKK